jgi:hypothetical protein
MKGGPLEALLSILDFVGLIAYLVVVTICFLKGRHEFAWFGVIMLVTGAALSFQGLRYLRDGLVDDWWWAVFNAQSVAVLLLSVALRDAKLGSWWDRRNRHSHGDGQVQDLVSK